MKKLIAIAFFPFVISSCLAQSEYEKPIREYLETQNGIKTDLKIEFLDMNVSDISVADSIAIIQEHFEVEKAKKVESQKSNIARWQKSIEEQKGKKNQVVAKALITKFTENISKAEKELGNIESWHPEYLDRYKGRKTSDVLAKKADTRFSYLNPKLQTRQEMQVLFILSADGKQCYRMIKQ